MSSEDSTLNQVRSLIQKAQTEALQLGINLRTPPPEPTTCCGRGCNGCVWEGFYAAAAYWLEEAELALAK